MAWRRLKETVKRNPFTARLYQWLFRRWYALRRGVLLLRHPGRLPGRLTMAIGNRLWDWRHGVRTATIVEPGALGMTPERQAAAGRHQAVTPALLQELLAQLPLGNPERFTFVDLGAGLGRGVLLAGTHPFRRVVGVELAPALCPLARANVASWRGERRCHDITILEADATTFPFPGEPLVVYLYNPFQPPVLAPVIKNLSHRIQRSREPLLVVYVNPVHQDMVAAVPGLHLWRRGPGWIVFRTSAEHAE